MDLEQMLARVKMEQVERTPTLRTLNLLSMAFVSNIPYENLDMCGGKKKVLDLRTNYDNVVLKKRGGFCCDLNGLFQWVLKEFGFKLDLLFAGAVTPDNQVLFFGSHMVLAVTVENGDKWLADVGWGGSSFALPLKMELGIEQAQPNGIYRLSRINNLYTVEKKKQTILRAEDKGKIEALPSPAAQTSELRPHDAACLPEAQSSGENTTSKSSKVGTPEIEKDGNTATWQSEWHSEVDKFSGGVNQQKSTKVEPCVNEWKAVHVFDETPRFFEDFQEGHRRVLEVGFFCDNAFVIKQNEKGRKFFFNNLYYEKEYVSPDVIKVVKLKKCSIDEMYSILDNEFGIKLDFDLKIKTM